jgi:molybdate transport system permease protein
MTWYSAIFANIIVTFPLMYRTARGAFEAFDVNLRHAGQTLGLSNSYIFWRIQMPVCKQGIMAGAVLSFARALGEYGATSMVSGYTRVKQQQYLLPFISSGGRGKTCSPINGWP